jgi:phage shock protein A
MEDIRKLIFELKTKVANAANYIQLLENESASLRQQMDNLELEVKEKHSEIDKLKHQIEMIKIAKAMDSESSDKGSKQKIAELVREIDYCITLLR